MSRPEALSFPERSELPRLRVDSGRRKSIALLLSGSLALLFGSALVTVLNFGFNVSMARMLGPALFGHVSAMVTLFMLCSAITLSFQLVCAKFVARAATDGAKAAAARHFRMRAWVAGLVLGAIAAVFHEPIRDFLRLPSGSLVIILAFGLAFYIPLGVKRGALQGLCKFRQLSWNFVVEAASKLALALLLVYMGYAVAGAIGALSASVIIALLMPVPTLSSDIERCGFDVASYREGMQATIFFIGQVIITNTDVLMVKHYFNAELAGMYAAVALVGRVLYYASWQITSAMFPVSAAAKTEERRIEVLLFPFVGVLLICIVFISAMAIFPEVIVKLLFREHFRVMEPLLILYPMISSLYSLSVVLMAYEMSRKIANTGWLQLVFSGALVFAISTFHATLRQVIEVQIALMALLLLSVSLPFFKNFRAQARLQEAA
jgi:O-antigen/teichoic acid export membrane protein